MESDGRSPFGMLLRQFRLAAGLSQEALAERARVSTDGVSALERGTRRTPQRETLALLADALALTSEDRARFEASAARVSRPRGGLRADDARAARVHALPAAPTSFHGREDDLAAVADAVMRRRIVTLTGTGGVGKTRLAVETARAVADRFADGVWFIELAAIGDGELVLHRTAEAIGASLESPSLLDAVTATLRPRHALLIFDTCEHVLADTAALIDAIVQRTEHVHVLTTSRQALSAPGESVRVVPPLATTSAGALLTARAQAANATFALTDANAQSVADICRRVGGLPLAIELVAPKLAVLSPRHVADLLAESFRLLSAPAGSGSARQHTMRAVLDWSFALLGEHERTLFRRLGAFPDGCTFELCEAACADERLSRWDLVDALTTLVAKSLVLVDGDGDARRFRMLEPTREYALDHLERSGEREAVMERIAHALAGHVRRLRALWDEMENLAWQAAISTERETIRSVLAWSLAPGRTAGAGIALLVDIADPGLVFESHEVRRWYEQAAGLAGEITDPELAATFARCNATIATLRREPVERVCALAAGAVEAARATGNDALLGEALRVYGIALREAESLDDAQRAFAEGWPLTERCGSQRDKAALVQDWAMCDLRADAIDSARERLHRCALLAREGSNIHANTLATLGELAFSTGDFAAARSFAEQAVSAFRTLNLRVYLGVTCCNAAAYAIADDDLDGAQRAVAEGLSVLREIGMPYYVTVALEHCAVLAALRGDDDVALAILGYTQRTISGTGRSREPTERDGYERALRLLEERHGPERLTHRLAEGALLDESRCLELARTRVGTRSRSYDPRPLEMEKQ
jgi:predicted ATPase/DNA-binding XRE family transcriptional regulator